MTVEGLQRQGRARALPLASTDAPKGQDEIAQGNALGIGNALGSMVKNITSPEGAT